ncbi:MAG: hypothetical protein IKL28_05445 [Lachnospiraceae bacterium]|nr:hypothetical protein [Lachnospiraceae bacterium]
MDGNRIMIYFSTYEHGVKTGSAGYAAIFCYGKVCDVQLFYRGTRQEEKRMLRPLYGFLDGTQVCGEEILCYGGRAVTSFRTSYGNFIRSGKCLEELAEITLQGVKEELCGGRTDGQKPKMQNPRGNCCRCRYRKR